jgi:hypothetical protein
MSAYNFKPGLGDSSAYQVSGKPFVSGGLDVGAAPGKLIQIDFPSVTRWIAISNHDTGVGDDVKVAFSQKGYDSNNYFTVSRDAADYGDTMTARLEMKITRLYLSGTANNVDVIAGLTPISTLEISNNWSGSAGVG